MQVIQTYFRPMVHYIAVFFHPKLACTNLQLSFGALWLAMRAGSAHGQAALVQCFRRGTTMSREKKGMVPPRGAAGSNPDPPPFFGPPGLLVPALLQFEILGTTGGALGAKEFFAGVQNVVKLFSTLCVYTKNAQNTLGISGAVHNLRPWVPKGA